MNDAPAEVDLSKGSLRFRLAWLEPLVPSKIRSFLPETYAAQKSAIEGRHNSSGNLGPRLFPLALRRPIYSPKFDGSPHITSNQMSHENYDDLDDLLDETDLKNEILAEVPAEAVLGKKNGVLDDENASVVGPDFGKLHISGSQFSEAQNPASEMHKAAETLPKELEDLLQASGDDPEAQNALKALLAGLSSEGDAKDQSNETQSGIAEPKTFEDTISATMDRLNKSKKSSGSEPELDETELMEKLLQDMQKSISSEGGSGAGGVDGLLSTLLSELSSKEVLYEPLKELHTGYPKWLQENRESLERDELNRLENQKRIVDLIVTKFEETSYSDSDATCRDYINELMVEMQNTGAPPKELVGDVAGGAFPGFSGMGDNAAPELPSDCATQ